ncbi:MAG: tetratricopeptide repeat protein [bacterium]
MSEKLKKIKHYKLIELIGSGGMGEVHKAFDSMLERDVAIKIMHRHLLDEENIDARFMREARAAAKLVHPNIVTIHEVGKAECGRFIVMEYVNGMPLTNYLKSEENIKPEFALKLVIQILKGLSCAHNMGIFHRDIKPDNILVAESEIAKILDFGIAKIAAKEGLTAAGDILGTVEYMAPEQMLGEGLDHRCDIYATGVVLYQFLTKRMPFVGENPVAILYKILNEDPIPPSYYNSEVGQELDQVVLKAIHKSKDERWESAVALAEALEAILRSGTYPSGFAQSDDSESLMDFEAELKTEFHTSAANKMNSVFVGRENEFKRLVNLFGLAVRNQGQTVILAGEAGVGKSTLAVRLQEYARKNQAWVLYGACLYQEGMDAYLPFIDALRGFFSKESQYLSEKERLNLKNILREKVPLLQEFTERFQTSFGPPTSSEGQNEKRNMFESIYQLISLLSSLRTVLLIIDDIHWADEASLRLFHYLSHHVVQNRVLLVGISRIERYDLLKDGKPTMIVDMLARIRRESTCEQITLYRLSKKNCEALVDKSLAPAMFTEEFYELIYNETKGNPLFVLETLKLMRENGTVFFNAGAWYNKQEGFELAVPNRVEDVFVRRLSALNEDEREILQVAAVIGFKFDISLLATILETTKIKLLKNLQRVERELQILTSTEQGYQFEHPMLQDMLYNEIPKALAQEYHLMIAAEMEKIHNGEYGALVGEVAQHLRRGGQHEKAAPLLYEAAMRAFKLGAFREAGLFFTDFMDSDERSGGNQQKFISNEELYLKLGRCHEEAGRWDESMEAYKILLKLSEKREDPKGQINALERMGRIQAKHGDYDAALETYTKSIQLANQHQISGILSRLYNSAGIIHFEKSDFNQAMDYFKKTIQLLDSDEGDDHKAHALINMGIIANIRADYKTALENYEKALEIFEMKIDRKNQARVYHNIGMTYSDTGDWSKSIQAFERCLELTDKVEDKQLRGLIYLNMGKVYAYQESLTKAQENVEKALKMFKLMGDILNVAESYHAFGIIHSARGNFSEAELYLKESFQINEEKEYHEALAETCVTYGDVCYKHGDCARAKEFWSKAVNLFDRLNLKTKVDKVGVKLKQIVDEE